MKTYNHVDLRGRLHSFALQNTTTEKGEAISGDLTIEVSKDGALVTIGYFAYPTYNSGKPNKTYSILEDMLLGNSRTVVSNGDQADWIGLTGSIDISYFSSRRSNDDKPGRTQRLRGAFINENPKKEYLNRWKVDLLITLIQEVDADEERGLARFVRVNGYLADDYNKRLMEIQVQARSEASMNYILGLVASEDQPYYVSTWGAVSEVGRKVVRENAFGEPEVEEFFNSVYEITGMSPNPYGWGDEDSMTDSEYGLMKADLEAHKKAKSEKAQQEDEELAF